MKSALRLILATAILAIWGGAVLPAAFQGAWYLPAAASYTGPFDVVASPTGFYALRAGSAAIAAAATQKLLNIRNTSTNETCDVIVATSGGFGNVANCSGSSSGDTVAVFCAESGGNCACPKWYDQGSNAYDIAQSTAANQPALTLNCLNTSLPCLTFTAASTQILVGTSTVSVGEPLTFLAVAKRTGSASEQFIITNSGGSSGKSVGYLEFNASGNTADIGVGNGTIVSATASDNAFHSLIGVAPSSSSNASSMVVDGVATTGTVGAGGGTYNDIKIGEGNAAQYLNGSVTEAGLWASAFNSTQYGNMHSNQSSYWGTP